MSFKIIILVSMIAFASCQKTITQEKSNSVKAITDNDPTTPDVVEKKYSEKTEIKDPYAKDPYTVDKYAAKTEKSYTKTDAVVATDAVAVKTPDATTALLNSLLLNPYGPYSAFYNPYYPYYNPYTVNPYYYNPLHPLNPLNPNNPYYNPPAAPYVKPAPYKPYY